MTEAIGTGADWPPLDYAEWAETCSALHLWSQIVGKYRLAHTPWLNHSWHATLYVTPQGLTTGPVPDGNLMVTLTFDLKHHVLVGETVDGREQLALEAMSVSEFLTRTTNLVERLGGRMAIHGSPNEVPDPVRFAEDRVMRPYDREAVVRFHRVLLSVTRVFQRFRTAFLGKVSPAHLFWGSLDLAVTRFSGRRAPLHPGGVPGLPDDVTREAYSDEVSSAGFWPGGGGATEAMFYAYAYPTPDGFAGRSVKPEAAFFDAKLGEFLLSYEAIRAGGDPERDLMLFLQSTYEAAADLAAWDRPALECSVGVPGVPRKVSPK